MKATFYLRSGASFTVDVEKIAKTTNSVTGETTGFKWVDGERGGVELFHVLVEQVDAVTVVDAAPSVMLPPCPVCGKADWPEGGMHAARSIHMSAHERAGEIGPD